MLDSIYGNKSKDWHDSDWKILLHNSDDYFQMMELASQHKINSQILHNGHIALELVLKAAISREFGEHPHGHEIFKLTKIEVKGKMILLSINSNSLVQKQFNKIYAAWNMQYRYEDRPVLQKEANKYYNAFKEAYIWVKANYCQ